ncbi:hypothetical protein [Halorussus sp. AFM4]|uniref:hypothetical protein n=1 Tax=Halorussus sp. AFM4 TaxID=3421651 RepID=UPI003EBACC95
MTDDTSIETARQHLFATIEEALVAIGRRHYEQQSVPRRLRTCLGHWFEGPARLTIESDRLAFEYDPYRDTVSEVRFDGVTFDLHQPADSELALLADYPQALDGIATAITACWEDVTDTDCPHTTELDQATATFVDTITEARTTATLETVVQALRDDQDEVVELLFDVDQPVADQEDTELATLADHPIETVLYRDEDLALLLPERQLTTTWRGGIVSMRHGPREAFIVGHDDTPAGFFVHAVDATNLTATSTVTRDAIHDAMGFDRSLTPDTNTVDPDPNECIRVQGDLCLERTRTTRELRKRLKSRYRDEIEHAVTAEFGERFLRKRNLADYRGQLELTGQGSDVGVNIEQSIRGAEAVTVIERRFTKTRHWEPRQRSRHAARYRRAAERLERRLANYVAANDAEYTETVEQRLKNRVDDALTACGQLNLPIDNHLVVLGNARLHPDETADREPVRVVVPDRTTLHVVHDEHPQVDIRLDAGEYVFRLLDRGLQPESERPTW